MATAQLAALLHQIHRLASPAGPRTDRELLEDFTSCRDEAAFAALVSRHGPMVLRVCRRALGNHHDAEDAFQATFLVLAQQARSIRKGEALAGWLHGVAYRTALRAKRSAARRRRHEARALPPAPQAAPSPTWGEVEAALDEELRRLPERFRAAFVLRVLEGKSVPEAAAELGCKEGTVMSRLARARQLLQKRLARRGIQLSALLTALTLAQGAARAGVPAELARTTIRYGLLVAAGGTAAGMIPARVAALASGVTRAMLLAKAKTAAAVLLASLLAVAGAGALGRRALAGPKDEGKSQAAAPQPDARPVAAPAAKAQEQTVEVSGRVLDPDGKPVAGAHLYLPRRLREHLTGRQDDFAVIRRGTTGADGRFLLRLPSADAHPGWPVPLLGAADGFGLDWVELPQKDAPEELTFRLVKDEPIRGRIVTTEGKPLAGVRVAVRGVGEPQRFDDFVWLLRRDPRIFANALRRRLGVPLTEVLRVTPTDKGGRFRISGIGADRVALLQITDPALASASLQVVTRAGLDTRNVIRDIEQFMSRNDRLPQVYGASFEYVAESARPIEGTVREAGSGKPVAGATIQARGNTAIADAQGHYRLLGLGKAPAALIQVSAPEGVPLISRLIDVPDAPGLEPLRADIELSRGVLVAGRVFDKVSGKGIKAYVHFAPLPGNELGKKRELRLYATADTDADGRFRLVVLPGPGVLLAMVDRILLDSDGQSINPCKSAAFDAADRKRVKVVDDPRLGRFLVIADGSQEYLEQYNACKVLDVKEGDGILCGLAVDPGRTRTVNVADPEGRPLAGAFASGISAIHLEAIRLRGATCRVYALDPDKPRRMVLLHPGRRLAAVVTLRGDEKGPLTVRLGPSAVVTGRALDPEGQPITGAMIGPTYEEQVANALTRQTVFQIHDRSGLRLTDAEGRFRLEGVVPGLKFDLGLAKDGHLFAADKGLHLKPLKAGQALDLGDVRTKRLR